MFTCVDDNATRTPVRVRTRSDCLQPDLRVVIHSSMGALTISLIDTSSWSSCVAAFALILATFAEQCQKGEADPRGLRR